MTMTIIMQIYLTVFLGLVINASIAKAAYKIIFKDKETNGELIMAIYTLISLILTFLFGVYFVIALIWHLY